MNKLKFSLSATALTTTLLISSNSFAQGLTVLPVLKDGYKPEAVVSVMGGIMDSTQENVDSTF